MAPDGSKYIPIMQAAEHCGNCGAELNGPFCSCCGQRAKTPIVSLREFFSHALGDLFSVDSRIWRTLLPLLFRPGLLTDKYVAGQRGSYLPPFRTYLILSLLFFMFASLFGTGWVTVVDQESQPTEAQIPGIGTTEDDEADDFSCEEIEIGGISHELEERVRVACEKVAADNGDSLSRAFADNIPVMMFFFIPFVALLMKILYLFSHRKYIEHLLFLFHYHAFFFMISAIIVIAAAFSRSFPISSTIAKIITTVSVVYIPVYLLIALRRVYGQSWSMTGMKYVLLMLGYVVTMSMAFLGNVTYTAWML